MRFLFSFTLLIFHTPNFVLTLIVLFGVAQIIPILLSIGSNEAEQRSKGSCEINDGLDKTCKTDKCVCCLQATNIFSLYLASAALFFFLFFSVSFSPIWIFSNRSRSIQNESYCVLFINKFAGLSHFQVTIVIRLISPDNRSVTT